MKTLCLTTDDLMFHPRTKSLVGEVQQNFFPEIVEVKSTFTGVTVVFVQDTEAAYRNDYWDGEQSVYRPIQPLDRVKTLSLTIKRY